MTTQVRFGDVRHDALGRRAAYANGAGHVTSDVTGERLAHQRDVGDYSGFALYFDDICRTACNKVDASAFNGISFTIWGTTGGQHDHDGRRDLDDTSPLPGSLPSTPAARPAAARPLHSHARARASTTTRAARSDSTPITVTGTQAAPRPSACGGPTSPAGKPDGEVLPTEILAIYWQPAPWATATATPYPVDIHIDNLEFIP